MFLAKFRHLPILAFTLSLALPLAGCLGAPEDSSASTSQDLGAQDYDRFPTRQAIDTAFTAFQGNQANARARNPIPLNDFFGERVNGVFSSGYTVEFLKSDARGSGE